jgi:hypothetical protein
MRQQERWFIDHDVIGAFVDNFKLELWHPPLTVAVSVAAASIPP